MVKAHAVWNRVLIYSSGRATRSSDKSLLLEPSFGERAFSYSSPRLWNPLPIELKNQSTIDAFKSRLKTFLFDNPTYPPPLLKWCDWTISERCWAISGRGAIQEAIDWLIDWLKSRVLWKQTSRLGPVARKKFYRGIVPPWIMLVPNFSFKCVRTKILDRYNFLLRRK